jgi:hypothetical protein
MTKTRTFAVIALAGAAVMLSACGNEVAGDGSPGSDAGTTVDAEAGTPSVSSADRSADSLGTMVINQRLDVTPAEYPLPDVPTQVEAATAADLAEAYAVVPGIDEIVAELENTTLGAGERFFAYTVNACTTEDVSLQLRGTEVAMIVNGTALLRCAPPTTLVVWVVGDEVPSDAKPVQAIQK